jgi:glutamyl-tRNA reductase
VFTLPFHVVGCSHESTDSRVIGRLGIADPELSTLLRDVFAAGIPCVLLSTCNRTELYWWGNTDAAPIFRAWVTGRLGTVPPRAIERRDADLAVRHLFAVAAGLRSQRLGEPEILGQLRRAWMIARDAGVTVPALDGVFQRGIQAARRIRARAGEFEWGQSLGEAAAAFIAGRVPAGRGWASTRVLLVGTGAAAESAAAAIAARGPAAMAVTSRTDERALALAGTIGASTVPWTSRHTALVDADVVIFATRSKVPVVGGGEALDVMRTRAGADALWLDLGVPRNVEANIAAQGLSLFTLSDLPQDLDADAEGAAAADSALQHELARFATELHRRSLAERLPAMESIANDIARTTVQRLRASMGISGGDEMLTPELDAAAVDAARRLTRALLREVGSTERLPRARRVSEVA